MLSINKMKRVRKRRMLLVDADLTNYVQSQRRCSTVAEERQALALNTRQLRHADPLGSHYRMTNVVLSRVDVKSKVEANHAISEAVSAILCTETVHRTRVGSRRRGPVMRIFGLNWCCNKSILSRCMAEITREWDVSTRNCHVNLVQNNRQRGQRRSRNTPCYHKVWSRNVSFNAFCRSVDNKCGYFRIRGLEYRRLRWVCYPRNCSRQSINYEL